MFLQNKAVAYASGFQIGKNKQVEIQFNTDKIFIQQKRDQITFVLGKNQFSYALTDVQQQVIVVGFQIQYINDKQIISLYVDRQCLLANYSNYELSFININCTSDGQVEIGAFCSETESYLQLFQRMNMSYDNMSLITNSYLNLVLYIRLFEESDNTDLIALYVEQLRFKVLSGYYFNNLDVAQACTVKQVFMFVLNSITSSDVAQISLDKITDYVLKYAMYDEQLKEVAALFTAVVRNLFRFEIEQDQLICLCETYKVLRVLEEKVHSSSSKYRELTKMDNNNYECLLVYKALEYD